VISIRRITSTIFIIAHFLLFCYFIFYFVAFHINIEALSQMNTLGTLSSLNLNGGSCIGRQKDCTTQSLVKALDNFLGAMQQMRTVVMVPSKLKDITVDVEPAILNNTTGAVTVPVEKQNVDLFSCYQMLDTVNAELVNGPSASESTRAMMKAHKEQMVKQLGGDGTDQNEEDDEDSEDAEAAQKISSAFRQHLQGLFGILHYLTATAKVLSKKYQDEVDTSAGSI